MTPATGHLYPGLGPVNNIRRKQVIIRQATNCLKTF
jgi:hypothetical protein